jgi:phage minor structural protein
LLYLLNKDVRTVRWNGEPLHEATSAIVKETMNGDFTLTVKYPISDSGIYQLIQEDMLIKAPTPVLGAQLFRIKKPVENNDHLEITAYHISDDVMQRSITPVSVTSQSCGMALSRMVQNTKTALGDFSFNSDIQDRRTFNTTETETLYSVLLDGKHSIVGTWEGELVRDNFAMTIKKSRGENRGVVITTHKNLKDYQRTRNSQNVVTRIHAKSTFKPEGAEKETIIRVTVDSPLINSYPYINEKEYENNNAKTVEELQKWAQAKFSNEGIDKVSDAIKIEAYELDGQVVHMGDTVNLKSWKHNVDAFKKAIAYEFDALKEEYISLTFDDKAGTGGSRASGGLSSAADAILGVTESAQEVALEKALQNADLDFDHKAGLLRQEISDGIELAKAKAEEVKRELSDTIDQRFSSFNSGPLQEAKRRAEEALRNAGTSSLLAQEAKRIGLDSVAKLEEFKRQSTSAQMALSGDLDALKQTVTSEVNQASEYRRTTTEALSRMTGQMNGFATKSEVKQDIDGLTQTFAKMKVGGRNYYRDSEKIRTSTRFFSIPLHPYLTQENVGETWTLSFDLKINEGGEIRPLLFYHYQNNRFGLKASANITPSKEWQRFTFTGPVIFSNDDPRYSRGEMALYDYAGNNNYSVRRIKFEKGTLATDWSPAVEDTDGLITEAKATFERTAQGLRTDLSAIQEYVNKDGQRQDVLQRYAREESARQANAVRELVNRDFVGKATYQEDVRGLERKFEAITNPKNGLIATQIATYKNAVDGRFTEITSLISGKANQTDFQRVKETSQLYERILGNSENGIADKVARMAMTNQLFQVEVSKNEGLKTVQRQLAGSWGVHNKNSVNEIIAGFNLAGRNVGIKAETIRLEGNTLADKLTAIDGYFKRLFVGEGTFATLNTDVIRTNSITADKLVFNEALANRMVSNEIITSKLVASRAFVNALNAVTIDASQIVTGTLKGDRIYGGTIRGTEINGTAITGNSRMTIGDNGFLRPTQEGGLQINVPETYSANKGIGVQLFGRNFGKIPKGMFIYNSPNWNGGNIIGDNTEDILLTVKGRVSLCNLHNGSPVSGVPIISNFEYQNPIRNLYPIRFIGWDPRSNQLYVDDGTGKSGTWWISVDGSTSDKNLKTNIGDTHYNALDFVQKLMFKEFDWKTDKFGYKKPYTNVGLIAQDVEKIDSSLVYKKGETLALDDFRLLNIALKAIQELALENRKLTHRLENLENERRTA